MAASAARIGVHWFRKALRIHDNPALARAAAECSTLYPIFVLDDWFADPAKICANRYQFLLECLTNLDENLRKVNSRLLVLRGKPGDVVPAVLRACSAQALYFERDTEPYAIARDKAVMAAAASGGVEVVVAHGHTLYDPDVIVAKAKGSVPTTYQGFIKLVSALPPPAKPLPALSAASMPPVGLLEPLELWGCGPAIGAAASSSSSGAAHGGAGAGAGSSSSSSSSSASSSVPFAVPSLAEMGFDPAAAATPFHGGESEALRRLEANMARREWVAAFEKPETSPNALAPSTTVLSPYLKFGALSCRTFYWRLKEIYAASKAHSSPPVSLEGQLLWREFFYANAFAYPNYDRMAGNPVCKQIAWDYNPALIKAWEEGRTGYPWIDAAMAQLRAEGWLHHLARHAVACFLTRGDLYQSWEHGAKVFDKLLLDSDWAINNGNWMWLSASAYFYQFFRVYSPVAFPKKTDPNGDYIRKYLPQFKDFPAAYIYEPWKAPKAVQEKHGVIVGVTYPARIVIHEEASKANIARHAAAYEANKGPAAGIPKAAPGAGGVGASQVASDPSAALAYFRSKGALFAAAEVLHGSAADADAADAAAGESGAGAGAGAGAAAAAAGPGSYFLGSSGGGSSSSASKAGKSKSPAAKATPAKGGAGAGAGSAVAEDGGGGQRAPSAKRARRGSASAGSGAGDASD